MNPYQPPRSADPTPPAGESLVMSVRYGRLYALLLALIGFLTLASGIITYGVFRLASALFFVSGVLHLAIAVRVWKRVYFEVFADRIEFLSPVFPRWRRAKPLQAIGSGILHRWIANGSDLDRFLAYRRDSRG